MAYDGGAALRAPLLTSWGGGETQTLRFRVLDVRAPVLDPCFVNLCSSHNPFSRQASLALPCVQIPPSPELGPALSSGYTGG